MTAEEEKVPVKPEASGKYICPVCGYVLKVHDSEREFRCPLCGTESSRFVKKPLEEE